MVMGFVFAILLSQIDYQVIFRMKEVVFTVLYFLALGGVAVAVGQKKGIVNGTYIVLGDSIIINYEVLVELITCIFLISMLNRKKYSSDFSYRYRAIILLLLFSGNISLIIVVSTLIIVTLAIRDVKKAGLIGIGTIVWWGSVYIFLEKIAKIPIWEKILQKQLADSIQVMGNIYMTASGGIFGLGFGNTSIQEGVFSIEQSYITSLISQQFGILGILIFLILYMIFFWRAGIVVAKANTPEAFSVAAVITIRYAVLFIFNLLNVNSGLLGDRDSFPFVGYSGTENLLNMVLLGVLLSVSRRNYIGTSRRRLPLMKGWEEI